MVTGHILDFFNLHIGCEETGKQVWSETNTALQSTQQTTEVSGEKAVWGQRQEGGWCTAEEKRSEQTLILDVT